MSAALVALVLPLCSAYARAQHAATGHDLRRAVAIRDGGYQARTPSEGAADRALAYVMAAALYPAAAARYTATAYGWAEEAGVDVAALAGRYFRGEESLVSTGFSFASQRELFRHLMQVQGDALAADH